MPSSRAVAPLCRGFFPGRKNPRGFILPGSSVLDPACMAVTWRGGEKNQRRVLRRDSALFLAGRKKKKNPHEGKKHAVVACLAQACQTPCAWLRPGVEGEKPVPFCAVALLCRSFFQGREKKKNNTGGEKKNPTRLWSAPAQACRECAEPRTLGRHPV